MVSGGDESSRMMETVLDCFMPSTRIAAPSLQELCSTICASLSSFYEPMLKTLLLVICFVCKQSWTILEDHHNFIIARACTRNRCGVRESSTSYSNTNIFLFGALFALYVLIFTDLECSYTLSSILFTLGITM